MTCTNQQLPRCREEPVLESDEPYTGMAIDGFLDVGIKSTVLWHDKENDRWKLVRVKEEAFKLDSRYYDETLVYAKGALREAERPLKYGEMITWTKKDVDINGELMSFKRGNGVIHKEYDGNGNKFKVSGVLDPNSDRIWIEGLPDVTIFKFTHIEQIVPNVKVNLWIRFNVDPYNNVKAEFVDFADLPREEYNTLSDTPWADDSVENNICLMPEYDSDGETFLPFGIDDYAPPLNRDPPKGPTNILHYLQEKRNIEIAEGWASSERTIYSTSPELNGIRFWLPLAKKYDLLVPGFPYYFSAMYNPAEHRYMIYSYWQSFDKWPLKHTRQQDVNTTVTMHKKYPGFYTCSVYGIVRDSRGLLALVPFSPSRQCPIKVGIREEMDDLHMGNYLRMHVTKFKKSQKKMLDEYIKTVEVKVENRFGIAISKDVIFCKSYPNVAFWRRVTDSKEFIVGQAIKFSALYFADPRDRQFYVTEWNNVLDKAGNLITIETASGLYQEDTRQVQTIFRTRVKGGEKYSNIVESPEFGLLDVGHKEGLFPKKLAAYYVWVQLALTHVRQPYFNSRLDAKCIAFGQDKPREKQLVADVDIREKVRALLADA